MKTTFKRFLPLLAVCLVALTALGATIQWYSQQPVTTALKNTDVLVLETTGPQGYKSFTLTTLKGFIGTNGAATYVITNAYITNLFANTIYVSNEFVTNAYITNAYITNLTVQNITNQTLHVAGKATILVLNTLTTTATNGFYLVTNSWSGAPTGTVDLALSDQGYRTFTPLSITGFINLSNTVAESVIMAITNASTTNILWTLPSGLRIPERTNQVAVSNASVGMLSIRYHPAFGTNGVYRQF